MAHACSVQLNIHSFTDALGSARIAGASPQRGTQLSPGHGAQLSPAWQVAAGWLALV